MSTRTLLTLAEFEKLPEKDGVRYELDEGELVEMTLPRPRHNRVLLRVTRLLDRYLENNPVGEVFVSDTPYLLAPDPGTLRGPDASFLTAERATRIDADQIIDGAPDLAVEVVSPNDSARDLNRKVEQYLGAGAHTVWVVYPDTRQVVVHDAQGIRKLTGGQKLECADLLPGFSAPVSSIFE